MTDQTKAPAAGGDTGLTKNQHSNSSEAQRRRLLDRLRIGPVSTLDARRELDILMPAARIWELRRRGHRIDTFRVDRLTDCGRRHNVALYALQTAVAAPSLPGDALDKCGRHSGAGSRADGGAG